MSRAFTKEDGWEDPVVAPRAPLPDGVPNYVTPRGLAALRAELADLEAARVAADAADDDEEARRRRRAVWTRRVGELETRIATAQVVDPREQPRDTVRFGARVTLRDTGTKRAGETSAIEIVGVDEADPEAGRIAFTAPLARAALGRRVGEAVTLTTGRGAESFAIVAIAYDAD